MDRFLHELRSAPAAQEQADEVRILCRHLKGLMQATVAVKVGEVGSRVVAVVPAAFEHYPAVVRGE